MQQVQQNAATPCTAEKPLPSNAFSPNAADAADAAGVPPQTTKFVASEVRETIDLAAFSERAAILEHDAGLSRAEAERAAARELGHDSAEALYLAAIEAWRGEILALPKANTREAERLVAMTLGFLASEWALKALAAGWDEPALFGVFDGEAGAMRSRYDAQGLVPAIALSVLTLKPVEITADAAILQSRTGSRLRHGRFLPGAEYCASWWSVSGHAQNPAQYSARTAAKR